MLKENDSDISWQQLAQSKPYWAVLTAEEFREENLDQEKFVSTGESYLAHIAGNLQHLVPSFRTRIALDFGYGVGRLINYAAVTNGRARHRR